uniref:Uncharacterized protein n=1 Tax=Octopus bimaculoides TaxID=37653 RepID=A0A0L8HMY7_OCTBM
MIRCWDRSSTGQVATGAGLRQGRCSAFKGFMNEIYLIAFFFFVLRNLISRSFFIEPLRYEKSLFMHLAFTVNMLYFLLKISRNNLFAKYQLIKIAVMMIAI